MQLNGKPAQPSHLSFVSDAAAVWRRIAVPMLYIVCALPGIWTFYLAATDQLGADPVKVLERTLGLWSLRFLIVGLSITPLRAVFGINLMRYRRAIGLIAFFYALAHVTCYLWLDQNLVGSEILKDIIKRPYITIGLVSFVILVALAVTSNTAMIKRLGPAWQKLHRWVYLAAVAAVVHFIMLVKAWPPEPLVYAVLVAGLLAVRVFIRRTKATSRKRGPSTARARAAAP